MVNGKWRYYYDTPTGGATSGGRYTKDTKGRYGTYYKKTRDGDSTTINYKKSNKLFSNYKGHTFQLNAGPKTSEYTYYEGRLERGIRSTSKTINKFKKNTLKSLKGASKKGESMLKKLFGGSKKRRNNRR